MKYFLQDKDNIIISYSNIEVLNDEIKNIEINEDVYKIYLETPERLYLLNHNLHIMADSEWEKYLEQKERERIDNLRCTKRVFVLMLEKMGLDYFEQIEPLINNNRQAKLEWELCVELERSNKLLDILATELGVTSLQLDKLFQYANGEDVELEVING